MIDKALEHAKDLYEAVKEKHAEAKAAFEETERLIRSGGIGQNSQHQQHQGGGQGQYGQPIHYPGAQQQQQQQDPYGYQANQYSQPGLTAPLPPGEAPPPPPAAPGQDQAASATAAAGAAQNGMTTEQWTAYWNSLDPASQAYYTQYVELFFHSPSIENSLLKMKLSMYRYYAAYAAYGQQPQAPTAQAPAPPSSAPPPPPSDDAQKGGRGAYGAVPPPPGL